jgi:hypothetical protein
MWSLLLIGSTLPHLVNAFVHLVDILVVGGCGYLLPPRDHFIADWLASLNVLLMIKARRFGCFV